MAKVPVFGKRKQAAQATDSPGRVTQALGKVLGVLARLVVLVAPFVALMAAPTIDRLLPQTPDRTTPLPLVDWATEHLTALLIALVPLLLCLSYLVRNYLRVHPPTDKKGKPVRPPQPPLPSIIQRIRDVTAIIATLDHIPWRVIYLALFAAAVVAPILHPVPLGDVQQIIETARGGKVPQVDRAPWIAALVTIGAYLVIHLRTSQIIRNRQEQIEQVYAVARDTLSYPKRKIAQPTRREKQLAVPHIAVDVKEWAALDQIDKAFVLVPEELSVSVMKAWDQFDANLNAKMPRDEQWRIQRDPRGRGATIGPANYPTQVLWDGQFHPDPLTFYLGVNLETGEDRVLTLGEVSPHLAVSGGTSSGKSLALDEMVATPEGLRRVGDLQIGDLVFTPDGSAAPVTNMSPITTEDVYEVRFSDGSAVTATADHRWTTLDHRAYVRRFSPTSKERRYSTYREAIERELAATAPLEEATVDEVCHILDGRGRKKVAAAAERVGVSSTVTQVVPVCLPRTAYLADRDCLVRMAQIGEAAAQPLRRDWPRAVRALAAGMEEGEVITKHDVAAACSLTERPALELMKRAGATRDAKGRDIWVWRSAEITRYPKGPLLRALLEEYQAPSRPMALAAVRTTAQIAATLTTSAGGGKSTFNHRVAMCSPVRFPHQDLPVDPGALGVALFEPEGREEVLRAAAVSPQNPHLPQAYLLASVEQRLALLRGIVETAGQANTNTNRVSVRHDSQEFAEQIRSLVASLGMAATIEFTAATRWVRGAGFERLPEAWTIEFAPLQQVFSDPDLPGPGKTQHRDLYRQITAVEKVGRTQVRCLMVAHDSHEFLVTDQYLPTHNTSAAEVIAAQVLVKPMPWDPELHGMVVIIDPKGPLARRWRGRPGVVVADGQADAAEPDENGDVVTGFQVMASAMEWLEDEHQRRATVMAKYPDVGTWVQLPDEVKKAERFFPIFVVLDEYIDHTEAEKGDDERIEKENAAREVVTRLTSWQARKVRNVGMHLTVIAQRVNMSVIGNVLMTNLPVRIVTGQMDGSQMSTMFQTDEIPSLPSTRTVMDGGKAIQKTIPGRARVMNAIGQQIDKVQVMWFGGKSNSETLDKWLPRGDAPPNGDFSLPTGKPRRPEDFDAQGNFVGADQAKDVPVDTDAAPMDTNEPSAGDFDSTQVPEHVRDDEEEAATSGGEPDGGSTGAVSMEKADAGPEGEDDGEELGGSPGEGGERPEPTTDPEAIFPAATATPPQCTHCVNDADGSCSECGEMVCHLHTTTTPDGDWVCADCQDDDGDAVEEAGLAEFRDVMERAAEYDLTVQSATTDQGVTLRLMPTDPQTTLPVARVTSDGTTITLHSAAHRDGVQGSERAMDALTEVIDRYAKHQRGRT